MGNVASTTLLASLAALVTPSLRAQQREPVVCDGAHFRIEFLNGELPADVAGALAKQALEIVEGAWPVFEKAIQPKNPTKATLCMRTDTAQHNEIANRLLPDALENTVVVTTDGSESHVLCEPVALSALRAQGIPPTYRRDLLFAAAKQLALRQLGERADDWLSDLIGTGLAESVLNPQRRLGVDLSYDAHRVIVVHSYMFSSATELLGTVGTIKSANDRWALGMYYRYLALLAEQLAARTPNWPQRLIASWPKLPRNSVSTKDRYEPIEAMLGKDWKKTQERFEKSYAGAKIPWEAWGAVWRRGDDWILSGSAKTMAGICGLKQTPGTDWTLRCTLQWEPTDERCCPRVRIDWNGRNFVGVQFTPEKLKIETLASDGTSLDVFDAAPIEITVGEPVDFRADVVGKRLVLAVNGKTVFEHDFPARSMHEAFAFEVNKTVLQVRGLKIEARPMKK
jgi:hypothetical protein